MKVGVQPSFSPASATRNPFGFAHASQVSPHIAALGGEDVERRIVPAERLEDRPEQEGAPAQLHPRLRRQLLDAHDGGIGIGAAELVPELDAAHDLVPVAGESCLIVQVHAARDLVARAEQ